MATEEATSGLLKGYGVILLSLSSFPSSAYPARVMVLFPPPPLPPAEDAPHPIERLLAGGAGATALALGVGRMLRVVERKEARTHAQACGP